MISGDSFAADTAIVNPTAQGWVNLIAKEHAVTNIAQAGISEYKILKQIQSVNLYNFDQIIIVHTSPYRVHIKEHPIHLNSPLHKNCDLLYTDLVNAHSKNAIVDTGIKYFKYIFDEVYYNDLHTLMVDEIRSITSKCKVLHVTFFEDQHYAFLNLSNIWKQHPGDTNHLNNAGNQLVFNRITQWINQHS